ncbi:unnamed protein product, partial [Adineta steineri]
MTPVKKTLEKVEGSENNDENSEEEIPKKALTTKKSDFEGQLTQLEATFTLDKIILPIDEALNS